MCISVYGHVLELMAWQSFFDKVCFVVFHNFSLPIVTTPKTFIELHSPTDKIQALNRSSALTSNLIHNILHISLTSSLTNETGRVPCFSSTSYKFLCMFRICSHAMARETRRRIVIMGVKVTCSRCMDKGTKTHIRHDSHSISVIRSAKLFLHSPSWFYMLSFH